MPSISSDGNLGLTFVGIFLLFMVILVSFSFAVFRHWTVLKANRKSHGDVESNPQPPTTSPQPPGNPSMQVRPSKSNYETRPLPKLPFKLGPAPMGGRGRRSSHTRTSLPHNSPLSATFPMRRPLDLSRTHATFPSAQKEPEGLGRPHATFPSAQEGLGLGRPHATFPSAQEGLGLGRPHATFPSAQEGLGLGRPHAIFPSAQPEGGKLYATTLGRIEEDSRASSPISLTESLKTAPPTVHRKCLVLDEEHTLTIGSSLPWTIAHPTHWATRA
jgi:hypothetical protein